MNDNAATRISRQLCRQALALSVLLIVVGCGGDKEQQKAGQSLVKVNDKEITVHQLNEELERLAGRPNITKKQVLESLVNRQLLLEEAERNKIDRDPKVMQTIERAKAEIITQAYLKGLMEKQAEKPSKAEVDAFFQKHPELFSQRKLFNTKELVVLNKELNAEFKTFFDTAKSIEEITAWLDERKIHYAPRAVTRSTTDLPLDIAAKWEAFKPGDKLVMNEGAYSILALIEDIRSAPLTEAVATPQIEQYLRNLKIKEASERELARLKTAAKIEYLNSSVIDSEPQSKTDDKQSTAKPEAKLPEDSIEQGVKGLR